MEFAGEITDPVHRYIRFSQVEREVIDSPAFQRLRRIRQLAGAQIQTAQVDVLDKDAVAAFVHSVAEQTGRIDISFCATSTHKPGGDQGAALAELSYEDFSMPLIGYTKAHFNTTNAVSPYMIKQDSG